MSNADAISETRRRDALLALGAVLESGAIGERSRLRSLLRYVVEEELDGRGGAIKAYSIGVDVLGRGEDFDPSADSVVRVEVNRLRHILRAYYDGPGADDPVEIALRRGSYRPEFIYRITDDIVAEATGAAEAVRPQAWIRRRLARSPLISAAVLAALATGLAAVALLTDFDPPPAPEAPPIVEVGQIDSLLTDPSFDYLADGVRALLISDLSHFRTIRVRAAAPADASPSGAVEPADFRIFGQILRPGEQIRLNLVLIDAATRNILWSADRDLPAAKSDLFEIYSEQVRAIAGELGSPSGALVAEAIRRANAADTAGEGQSTYLCLLRWHAYDLVKTDANEARARACLEHHVERDVSDGSIHAAYAFMRFLDWTRSEDRSDEGILIDALAAADVAIRLDPTGSAGHEYKGSILLARGRFDAAQASFLQAMRFNPSKVDLQVQLGWAAIRKGDWDKGVSDIRQGVARSPAPPGWFRIPLSMDAYRRGDYQEALEQGAAIARTGDGRGAPLALAAAIKLNDAAAIARFGEAVAAVEGDPFGAVEAVLPASELLTSYRKTVADWRAKR